MQDAFVKAMSQGYALSASGILLGCPMLDGEVTPDVRVQLALAMANRHGLIAGATGTGKTTTLKIMAAELSDAGVPVFISDIKGDVTGIAGPNDPTDKGVVARVQEMRLDYHASGHAVEFLSLSGKLGAQVRATVSSFGPVLLGKVLDLNETQTSILSMVFKYCDDNQLPLLDLKDLQETLKFLSSDAGKPALADYGGMSPASVGVLQRSMITFEQSGADIFFGEPEFDVNDLMRLTPDGKGVVSVLELSDVMDKPQLFSTFMLWLLARLYHSLPEVGDLPKPKLAFFFDEAHLLFDDASEALLDQIEQTVRLIRSKGVGVYFSTQAPTDIPASVLGQLGNRVEHALRAFTAQDADNLQKVAKTYPTSQFYDIAKTLTSLGIGEALVTVLTPKGVPTPLAAVRLVPPDCLFGALDQTAFQQAVASGSLKAKYGTGVDRQSAYEILAARLQAARQQAAAGAAAGAGTMGAPAGGGTMGAPGGGMTAAQQEKAQKAAAKAAERAQAQARKEAAAAAKARDKMIGDVVKTGGKVLTSRTGQSIIRGVFGVLFGSK
ncbi:MAG TPA: helicase HerA-like domain-containing protein [Candidatus Limnocylindrales bacterium]|nr:helicase HerA-like domain-containing protein [Candidatus Limnocylindrales bacterium]